MLFDFGQPTTGIIQIAFVVEDLEASMREFTASFGAGPWTVLRDFAGANPEYHGRPTSARAHVALGFAGGMQYELIQPADDSPSVHRDVIEQRGYGFHHFGFATTSFDESVATMRSHGYEVVFSANVGPNSRVAYFDTRDRLPGMTELLESGEALNEEFSALHLRHLQSRAAASHA